MVFDGRLTDLFRLDDGVQVYNNAPLCVHPSIHVPSSPATRNGGFMICRSAKVAEVLSLPHSLADERGFWRRRDKE